MSSPDSVTASPVILLTGTAGRVGSAIYQVLANSLPLIDGQQSVLRGVDRVTGPGVDLVGDLRDANVMEQALSNVKIVVHSAALHAPHVGQFSDDEFDSINVDLTEQLFRAARVRGLQHFVFTSTTALYGHACQLPDRAAWIDEHVTPQPRTIYHRSKIAAEQRLQTLARTSNIPVTVLQMSRCFPEPANKMALYRLHRGIDVRDVANAHKAAIAVRPPGFKRLIISAHTPFQRVDCRLLYRDAAELIRRRAPDLADSFARLKWSLPSSIDRVYDADAAHRLIGWRSTFDFQGVLTQLDTNSTEVLAPQ